MIARAEASPVSKGFQWLRRNPLSDLRVQYGTKFGLAGLLALYCANVLRLEHSSWSILTVVVMMNSQYVGSITVKVILRISGTISGAVLGIWLVGSYASSPVILLTVVFFCMAFATYKFGQYPASQTPYFHFLIGLTLLTVATYGVDAPDQIWETGLNRMLETLVGALSALVVTSLLWPRYAREEFFGAGRSALETASALLSIETDAYVHGKKVSGRVEEIREKFALQLSTLRNLLQAGARESTYFRARLANYNAFLVSLTDLFQSTLDLEERRQDESPILESVRKEIEDLNAAISADFAILTPPRPRHEKLPPSRTNECFALLEKKVMTMRSGEKSPFLALPIKVVASFLGHYSAIRSVCEDLENIRHAMDALPRSGQVPPARKNHWDFHPTIDWFWVQTGIKGGLASVIGLLLLRWIKPPGTNDYSLGGLGFHHFEPPVCPNRRYGGCKNLSARLFRWALFHSRRRSPSREYSGSGELFGHNLSLLSILFALGFFTARLPGLTFWSQVVILGISTFVGLNPQQTVPSLTIIETFLGLLTGIGHRGRGGEIDLASLAAKIVKR